MDSNRAETLFRITEQYVRELHNDQQPKLSEYIAHYPSYADDIADFIAYYHAIEEDIPKETEVTPDLPHELLIAMNYDSSTISQLDESKKIDTLFLTVHKQVLSESQLASELDVSVDIVSLLEHRRIKPDTIPGELYKRLSKTLHVPLRDVRAYLGREPRASQRVAETASTYQLQQFPEEYALYFRELVIHSEQLSEKQKKDWLSILDQEGL
ncbi:MAG: hypothetical protein M3Z24_15085 [Chloroflexota bacterium]|nr:hypothetical protein [Chloroflexota bacterium]